MAGLLKAIIADPSPGPSVIPELEVTPSTTPFLSEAQRADLARPQSGRSMTEKTQVGTG